MMMGAVGKNSREMGKESGNRWGNRQGAGLHSMPEGSLEKDVREGGGMGSPTFTRKQGFWTEGTQGNTQEGTDRSRGLERPNQGKADDAVHWLAAAGDTGRWRSLYWGFFSEGSEKPWAFE